MRNPSAKPRILVIAYACEPGRGSEPGAGWGIVRALLGLAECTVLVGPEHVPGLDRWLSHAPDANLSVVAVPEPWWGRFAKRHRLTWFPLYLVWLRRARRAGLQMHQAKPFDLTYHATYSAYWLPSPVTSFGVPSIWGPVGGAVVSPRPLWSILGFRGMLGELLDALATRTLSRMPATRLTWHAASVRLVQNEATLESLPVALQASTRILNHATLVEAPPLRRRDPKRRVLSIGPLESRKGVGLAIRGLAEAAEDIQLIIVGDGPRRLWLRLLARRLGVAHRVEFVGRISREGVFRLLEEAAATVFTGLREEGGLALAESLACGVPTIVLANGGARTIAELALDHRRVAFITPRRVAATSREIGAAMTRFCDDLNADPTPNLDVAHAMRDLHGAVMEALQSGRPVLV